MTEVIMYLCKNARLTLHCKIIAQLFEFLFIPDRASDLLLLHGKNFIRIAVEKNLYERNYNILSAYSNLYYHSRAVQLFEKRCKKKYNSNAIFIATFSPCTCCADAVRGIREPFIRAPFINFSEGQKMISRRRL